MELVSYKRPQRALPFLLPCEGAARGQSSMNQETGSHQTLNWLVLYLELSSLQNCGKYISFVYQLLSL